MGIDGFAITLANITKIGLLTPEITLKLKSMLRPFKSAGKEIAKPLKRLSIIIKKAKEYLNLIKKRKARKINI